MALRFHFPCQAARIFYQIHSGIDCHVRIFTYQVFGVLSKVLSYVFQALSIGASHGICEKPAHFVGQIHIGDFRNGRLRQCKPFYPHIPRKKRDFTTEIPQKPCISDGQKTKHINRAPGCYPGCCRFEPYSFSVIGISICTI